MSAGWRSIELGDVAMDGLYGFEELTDYTITKKGAKTIILVCVCVCVCVCLYHHCSLE